MTKHNWAADDVLVEGIVAAGGVQQYAASINVASATLRHRLARQGIYDTVRTRLDVRAAIGEARDIAAQVGRATTGEQKPSATIKGNTAIVVSRPSPKVGDPAEWIREAGLEPDEWEVANIRLNSWDAMTSDKATGDNRIVQMFQVRADCKRKVKLDWLFPASDVKQRRAPVPKIEKGEPQRVMLFPDQHAPYQSEPLHYLAMCHAVDWKPHRIVNLGDICDFSRISRHRDNPAYFASNNECVDGAISILNDQRTAAPDAIIDLIEGNHDARPRTELLARAERMYDMRPGMLPGDPEPMHPWSLRHLLSLDRFHVNFVGPELEGDNYFHGLLNLTPNLGAIHGFLTGAGSEKATAERLGMSVIYGHIHRQIVHHISKYKGRDKVAEYVAISPGTMRATRGGGGFSWNPNWQQGYVTLNIWPDGEWNYTMVRFDGKTLIAGDKRYR